jgi:hypothetical protein
VDGENSLKKWESVPRNVIAVNPIGAVEGLNHRIHFIDLVQTTILHVQLM